MQTRFSHNMAQVLSWIKSNAGSTKTELMAALSMTTNQVTHIFQKIRPHLIPVKATIKQGTQRGWAINTNYQDDINDYDEDENIAPRPTINGARIVRVAKIMREAGYKSEPLKKLECRGVASAMGANYD